MSRQTKDHGAEDDGAKEDGAKDDEDDLRALTRAAEGDADAFAPIVERHGARLHRLCRRLLGDPEEAAEAVQETFLKAFRKAADFQPRAKVSTWLWRIATNHCLNRLRRRRVVRFLTFGELATPAEAGDDAPPEPDPADAAADPARRLEAKERWKRIATAIDRLSPGQRAVLVLVRFEGRSYRRTAEILGVTVGAVESRLFRAMRRLEKALDDDDRRNE